MKRPTRQRGFAFVVAIFLLVILAAFASFAVGLTTNSATANAVAVQGSRAYEAARAGIEWARFQVIDPNGTLAPGATTLPDCFASPRTLPLPGALSGFTVTLTCQRFPSSAATPNFFEEASNRVASFTIVATATQGTPGATDYVERKLEARFVKCKNAAAPGPVYAC